MTKMLESLVAKLLPVLSLTCTTSKEPGCLSRLVMTPIRPKLAPPVTMHRLPTHRKRLSTCVTQVEHQCILKLCGFYRKSSHQIILTVITVQLVVATLHKFPLATCIGTVWLQHPGGGLGRNKIAVLTGVKLDEFCDFAGLQVNANRVVGLDHGIRVAYGASIVGHQVRDSLSANEDFLHLAQLVLHTQWGRRILMQNQKQEDGNGGSAVKSSQAACCHCGVF